MERPRIIRLMMVQRCKLLIFRLCVFSSVEAKPSSDRNVTFSSGASFSSCCRHCLKFCQSAGGPMVPDEDSIFAQSFSLKGFY